MLRINSQIDREPIERVRRMCLSLRKSHKWTQGQLAMKLGVPRKTIENVEQEKHKTASRELYIKLLKLAGVNVGE